MVGNIEVFIEVLIISTANLINSLGHYLVLKYTCKVLQILHQCFAVFCTTAYA